MAMEAINNTTATQNEGSSQTMQTEGPSTSMRAETASQNSDVKKRVDTNEQEAMIGDTKIAESTIRDAVKKTNDMMRSVKCEFSYHEETHRVSIKVLDKKTDEVIREIPPEKSLDMLEKMWEMAGIIVDEKR